MSEGTYGRYPAARWRGPVPNINEAGMVFPLSGLVLHHQEGNEDGTDAWFHNPASQVSAHFGAPLVGGIDQWVQVGDKAWHAMAANSSWVGVELEGYARDAPTEQQIEAVAGLFAWLHTEYGVPLVWTNHTDLRGLAYHSMGGAAWGNHPGCPGTATIDARQHIVTRAAQLVGGQPAPAPEPTPEPNYGPNPEPAPQGRPMPEWTLGWRVLSQGVSQGSDIAFLQRWLGIDDDGWFGPITARNVLRYQAMEGLSQDAIVGKNTWAKLGHPMADH